MLGMSLEKMQQASISKSYDPETFSCGCGLICERLPALPMSNEPHRRPWTLQPSSAHRPAGVCGRLATCRLLRPEKSAATARATASSPAWAGRYRLLSSSGSARTQTAWPCRGWPAVRGWQSPVGRCCGKPRRQRTCDGFHPWPWRGSSARSVALRSHRSS